MSSSQPAEAPIVVDTSTPHRSIAARVDRLPVMSFQWRLVIISQVFWGAILAMDPLVLRIYPVVWEPEHAFSTFQYTLLVGFSNGFGPLLGVLIFGPLADRFGRKKIMVACCIIAALTVPALGVTSHWILLMIAVTGTGLSVGGALVTASTYNAEISPPKHRSRLMLGGQFVGFALLQFGGSVASLTLLPKHPFGFVAVFSVVALITIPVVLLLIPESPRWLETHHQYEKADKIISRVENMAISRGHQLTDPDYDAYTIRKTERVPVRTLFQGEYLKRTVLLLVVWVLIYIGIDYGFQGFQSVYLVARGFAANELFLVLLIGGSGSLIALIVGAALSERLERKTYVLVSAIVMVCGLAGYFFLAPSFFWIAASTVVTSFGVTACLASMYNYTAVAFPTRVRSTGIAVTDGVGHLGATFGATIASAFYLMTASANYVGWFLYVALAGTLAPAVLVYVFGQRQSAAALEEISQ